MREPVACLYINKYRSRRNKSPRSFYKVCEVSVYKNSYNFGILIRKFCMHFRNYIYLNDLFNLLKARLKGDYITIII